MKPRLTNNAIHGLAQLAGLVDAGGPAEIIGYDWEQMNAKDKSDWADIQSACRWIRAMQRHLGRYVEAAPASRETAGAVAGHSEPLAGPQQEKP